MATATAYYGVNMDTASVWYGNVTIANRSQIQITSGSSYQNYYGSFTYNYYGLTGGTATSTNYYEYGSKIYEITNGNYSALTVNSYLNSGNTSGLYAYIFSGSDKFKGSNQNDALNGFAGDDSILGYGGNDTLRGGSGADSMTGGLGTDSLYGGADKVKDVFDFNAIDESKTGSARDKVYDFVSKIDKIDLASIDANTTKASDQTFAFSGTTAKANSVWYKVADVDGDKLNDDIVIYGDVSGDAKADFEIGLVGVTAVVAADFVL